MTKLTIPQRWTGLVQASDAGGFVAYGDYLTAVAETYEQGKRDAAKVFQWVSVNERSPISGQVVLSYADSGLIQVRKYGKYKFPTHTNVVTHWMPLPKEPTE